MARIFGTDGVRGLANDVVTPELALSLGQAIVRVLREEGEVRPSVLIGRDPRWSGPMLQAALAAGVASAGGDAVDVGVVPTPAVALLTASGDAVAGAMISASHNPVEDNGIKFFGRDGFKLTDAEEDRLQQLLDEPYTARASGLEVGQITLDQAAADRYVDHVVASANVDLDGLKLVVDGANGAASSIGPAVYRALGAEVIELHCQPDGANINDGCGSTHPEIVCAAVVEHGAHAGVAHDGDADRMIAATSTGAEVDGDVVLAVLARDAHERGSLPGDAVATTVMTNLGFKRAMDGLGIGVVETAVGDRYVLEAMREHGLSLGGEQSGHLIQLDRATTGDGVLTTVRLLEVMRRTGATLDELTAVMQRLPQVLINVPDVRKDELDAAGDVWDAVDVAGQRLGDGGRVLIRKSGTEPLVRVMVEATSSDEAESTARELADLVARVLG